MVVFKKIQKTSKKRSKFQYKIHNFYSEKAGSDRNSREDSHYHVCRLNTSSENWHGSLRVKSKSFKKTVKVSRL